MKRFFSSVIIFAAGLSAQSFAPPAPPQGFEILQAFQSPQVFEFKNGTMVGGTYLGVNLAEIGPERAKELKLRETTGVEITRVEPDSPAEKAGIKAEDVVLEYNGQHVEGMEQFGRLVRETPAGRDVKLTISRNGATQTIAATVATRKMKTYSGTMKDMFPGFDMPEVHLPDMPQVFTTWRSPMMGVETESLSAQLATYFGVKEGVLVRSVVKDSAAERAGIKAGDVIVKVDGTKVTTHNELVSAIRSASSKKSFPVDLSRDRHETSVTVTIDDNRNEKSMPRIGASRGSVKQ
jgi:serine protease Do